MVIWSLVFEPAGLFLERQGSRGPTGTEAESSQPLVAYAIGWSANPISHWDLCAVFWIKQARDKGS